MQRDDLSLLAEIEAELDDPLDRIPLADAQTAEPPPDPEVLLRQLEGSHPDLRLAAARAFGELVEPRAVPTLIGLLHADCALTREAAAYALGRNPDDQAIEGLIDRLRHDSRGPVRKGCAWALGNYTDRRAIQPLLEALAGDIAEVRLWAASSLGNTAVVDYVTVIGAIPRLVEALRRDAVAVVRSNCAWSLGQLVKELPPNAVYATVIDGLIEALVEDDDMSVREDAKESLLQLGDARALQMIETLQQDGLLW